MRIIELLAEAIQVHSEGLLAWVITVGEAYAEKPTLVPQDAFHWQAMIYANQNLLSKVLSKIRIIPVPYDPYGIVGQQGGRAENAMIQDIVFNKQLKVYSGGNPHPLMSNKDNIMFRALHDFFTHAASQAKSLKAFYDRQQLVSPQDAVQLPPFALSSHSFTIRGEMNAYLTHTKLAPADAWAALFTEILGQSSYYFVTGSFPEQKVAVLDGFDLRQLGVCTGGRAQRMQELLAVIQDPSQAAIPTRINNVVIDKRQINWKLLSMGTAGRQMESAITEAQFGHIYAHMKEGPFIIISAWRNQYNRMQNRHRNADLKHRLYSDYGLAAIEQKGVWPIANDPTKTGDEDSLFVPMIQPTSRFRNVEEFFSVAKQLMIEYDQDAVVVNDGSATRMVYNPTRGDFKPPGVDQLGKMRIVGKDQSVGDAPGWSQKGHYRYLFGDQAG